MAACGLKENDSGRFIELELLNYDAVNDVFPKTPDEGKGGEVWTVLATRLKAFSLDGMVVGGLKIV